MITVYTSPACMPCRATKRQLEQAGTPYQEVDATTEEATAELAELGYTSTPVVVVEMPDGLDHWSGYRPDAVAAAIAINAA